MRTKFFTTTGYHLTYRNCNHFTETFATALILPTKDLLKKQPELKSYPTYVNRLARTGNSILDKSADKSDEPPCDVIKEARAVALGIEISDCGDDQKLAVLAASMKDNDKRRKQKKELTEKQKQILAKLKSPK